MRLAPATALLAAATCVAAEIPAHAAESRRLALLIANNEGGAGTGTLRYARDDAEKLGAVLRELGGFREQDLFYLFDASADRARESLAAIEARVQQARAGGAETTLLVYYSGHARDGALRMGDSRWPMAELRGLLARSTAEVRIGIIDACQSGAITRTKGGRPGPSFLFESDDGQPARGLVLITSSSDDEDSQESDELGGSYFTHHLTSGLRGDADESGDHRITLAEVYGYAYHKTITETVATRAGVQHPTYSFDLQGSGSLVLTELVRGSSALVFGAPLEGDYLIFDRAREQVAAEVKKVAGRPRRIALAPGDYVLKKRLADHLRVQRFELAASREHVVDETSMRSIAFEDDDAKKGGRDPGVGVALAARVAYQGHLSAKARDELFPPLLMLGVGVELERIAGATVGLDVTMGARGDAELRLGELVLAQDFFQAQIAVEMIWSWAPIAAAPGLRLLGGPRVAGVYLRRSFPEAPALPAQDHFALSPMGVAGLGFGYGRVRVEMMARLGFLPFSVDDNRTLFFLEGGMLLGVSLL